MALSKQNLDQFKAYGFSEYQIQQIVDAYNKNPKGTDWTNLATEFKNSIDKFNAANPNWSTPGSSNQNQDLSWNLSSWKADGGKWTNQPTLTIGGKTYKFNTPQEYISKLQELKTQGVTGPIDQFISEFQNVSGDFGGSNLPEFKSDEYAKNFDAGWEAYTKASIDAYKQDAEQNLLKYKQQQEDYDKTIERSRNDYNKWTTQNQYDFARSIAQYDKSFATALSGAASAYGQRGLLNSGLAKKAQQEAMIEANQDKGYMQTINQRNISDKQTEMNRLEQDYSTNTNRLTQSKNIFEQGVTSGLKVLEAGLKQQGATAYNQGLIQQWQSLYDMAKQNSLNQLYGRQATNYSLPFR